jgi:hypothetical protein
VDVEGGWEADDSDPRALGAVCGVYGWELGSCTCTWCLEALVFCFIFGEVYLVMVFGVYCQACVVSREHGGTACHGTWSWRKHYDGSITGLHVAFDDTEDWSFCVKEGDLHGDVICFGAHIWACALIDQQDGALGKYRQHRGSWSVY